MNDRFDFQLPSENLSDGRGLSLIGGSYHVFGNNGTHPLGGAINSRSNTWNPAGLTAPARAVLDDLARATDHLPVVADYQVPAVLTASATPGPTRVIAGAAAGVAVSVRNGAAVVAANGADRLDFAVGTSGDLSGATTGSADALAPARTAALRFDTATPGRRSGVATVTTSSQAAGGSPLAVSATADVLAHARPSLSAGSVVSAATLDFGIYALGSPAASRPVGVYNLVDPSAGAAFTARLDLDAVGFGGSSGGAFSTGLSSFSDLIAGGAVGAAVSLATGALGTFGSSLSLAVSDEDVPGAADLGSLVLDVVARVALGGDATLDGRVDALDLRRVAATFGRSGPSLGFADGDFDRNGRVDALDLRTLALNWTAGPSDARLASLVASLGLPPAAVPEPSGVAAVALAAGLLSTRRRRGV